MVELEFYENAPTDIFRCRFLERLFLAQLIYVAPMRSHASAARSTPKDRLTLML
jgi:hypothetical protein